MQMRKPMVALLLVAAGVPVAVSPAWSDPANSKNAFVTTLDCDNGNTYDVVVAGGHNANRDIFTPAHDLSATANFVPVAFEDFAGTIYDDEGTELFSFVDDYRVDRGNGTAPKGRTAIHCVYSVHDTFVAEPGDEQFGLTPGETYTVIGEGGVSGFATGRR